MTTTTKRFTLKGVQAELRAVGMTLTKTDGEYRVSAKGAGDRGSYYTNDLEDARLTGLRMARWEAERAGAEPGHEDAAYDEAHTEPRTVSVFGWPID